MTGSNDNTARVWNADGSDEDHPLILRGHDNWVFDGGFSPDGTRIVTVSTDKTARVWKADGSDKGHPLVLQGQDKRVMLAAFSSDGTRVVVAFDDMTSQAWHLSIPLIQQDLRAATTECLPPDLRRTYLARSDAAARAGYEACERSHGRAPFYPDAKPP